VAALASRPCPALSGEIRVPGDKSISHRALMIGALAAGETVIHGLLEGDDVLRTAAALRQMGVGAARGADGAWRVDGVGVGGLSEPDDVLDLGNSGTGARLLMGLVSTHSFAAISPAMHPCGGGRWRASPSRSPAWARR
jgi:3-phosphoshikimate 1-carboxyvinyltransferase